MITKNLLLRALSTLSLRKVGILKQSQQSLHRISPVLHVPLIVQVCDIESIPCSLIKVFPILSGHFNAIVMYLHN